MTIYVLRNGQQFGPYSEETARKYVAQGSLRLTDSARTDTQPNWVPLSTLLSPQPVSPVAGPYLAPNTYGAAAPTNYPPETPPSLHWGVVLLLMCVTVGVFGIVWAFVQASWVKKLNGSNKPIVFYTCWILGVIFGYSVMIGGSLIGGDGGNVVAGVGFLIYLASIVFFFLAIYEVRRILVEFYRTAPPVGLKVNAGWTFFFNILCLQHALTRVATYRYTAQMPV